MWAHQLGPRPEAHHAPAALVARGHALGGRLLVEEALAPGVARRAAGPSGDYAQCPVAELVRPLPRLLVVAGAAVWQLAAALPGAWLPKLLEHAITTVPTLASLFVLSQHMSACEAAEEAAQAHAVAQKAAVAASGGIFGSLRRGGASFLRRHQPETAVAKATAAPARPPPQPKPVGPMKGGRLWLSYWAFWPVLLLLNFSIGSLPRLLPSAEVERYRPLVQRGLLVFAMWLQAWQGCTLLQGTLHGLAAADLPEQLFGLFGASGLQVLCLARGIVPNNLGAFRFVMRLQQTWLFLGGGAVALLACLWIFHTAINMVMGLLTAGLWLFAAYDTSAELKRSARQPRGDSENQLPRKLAFWVLAMLWTFATRLPAVGAILRIVTPFSFALFQLGGEPLFRRLLYPLLKWIIPVLRVPLSHIRLWLLGKWQEFRRRQPPRGAFREAPERPAACTAGSERGHSTLAAAVAVAQPLRRVGSGTGGGGSGGAESSGDELPERTSGADDTGGTGAPAGACTTGGAGAVAAAAAATNGGGSGEVGEPTVAGGLGATSSSSAAAAAAAPEAAPAAEGGAAEAAQDGAQTDGGASSPNRSETALPACPSDGAAGDDEGNDDGDRGEDHMDMSPSTTSGAGSMGKQVSRRKSSGKKVL